MNKCIQVHLTRRRTPGNEAKKLRKLYIDSFTEQLCVQLLLASNSRSLPLFAASAANVAVTVATSIARTADFALLSLYLFSHWLPASLFRCLAAELGHFELKFALAAFRGSFALLACPAPATPASRAAAPKISASSAHSSDHFAPTPASSSLPPCKPALPSTSFSPAPPGSSIAETFAPFKHLPAFGASFPS